MFWESDEGRDRVAEFLVTTERTWTYQDVFDQADSLVSDLGSGLILILCRRDIETILGYVGALRSGLVPLMLDADLPSPVLASTIKAYGPNYICGPTEQVLQMGNPVAELGNVTIVAANKSQPGELHSHLTLLIPTSGSTGDPKTVRLTAENLNSCTSEICRYLEMSSQRRGVTSLPLQYAYGLSVLHNLMYARASLFVCDENILDREFWHDIEAYGVTDLALVPFQLELMRRMRFSEELLAQLQCVTQAGGRLDPKITAYFTKMLAEANVKYFTMYGQTEAAPRLSYVPVEQAVEKLGSVGIPLSIGQIISPKPGERGELIYKGPNVAMGYGYSRSDLSLGDEFHGELKTGDEVELDDDGFIFIVGRKKRFIKLHGVSINMDHVESTLRDLGHDCRVVGKENKVVICHMTNETTISAGIKENFGFHASTLKLVRVDNYPLTSAGKTHYVSLTEQFAK